MGTQESTKPLVIYHGGGCTDGYGAAFAAWLKLGDKAEYAPANYGDEGFKNFIDGREVYILDFSFPSEVMDQIFRRAKRVVWLDHHKSAFEMWRGEYEKGDQWLDPAYGWDNQHHIHLNDNKSGALLAWEFFHPDTEVPMLIRHIDDRDRWQWKLEGSAEIHAALGSYAPWSFEQWGQMLQLRASPDWTLMFKKEGAAILRAQKQQVERMAKLARKCVVTLKADPDYPLTVTGLATNAPIHQSEVGHELANASGTFGLAWCMGDDGKIRCSFRSNGEYDVSAIARVFGGGGHKAASGCTVSIDTLLSWMRWQCLKVTEMRR